MTKTHSKSVTAMAIAAGLVTAIIAYTFVCLLDRKSTRLNSSHQ